MRERFVWFQSLNRTGVFLITRRTFKHKRVGSLVLIAAMALAIPGTAAAQNLVGHLAFDGNLNDSSERGNHARRSAAVNFVRGEEGQALDMTGQTVTIANSASLQTRQFTVAYQVRLASATNYAPGASKGDAWQTSIAGGLDSKGRAVGGQSLRFCVGGVCGTSPVIGLDLVGRWMQVSFTYDGKSATTYADGIVVNRFEASVFPGNGTADVHLGSFGGQVREMRLYDGAVALAVTSSQTLGALLGTSALTVGSAAASSSVVLYAGGAWTATSNASFLHLAAGSTSGTRSIVVVFFPRMQTRAHSAAAEP